MASRPDEAARIGAAPERSGPWGALGVAGVARLASACLLIGAWSGMAATGLFLMLQYKPAVMSYQIDVLRVREFHPEVVTLHHVCGLGVLVGLIAVAAFARRRGLAAIGALVGVGAALHAYRSSQTLAPDSMDIGPNRAEAAELMTAYLLHVGVAPVLLTCAAAIVLLACRARRGAGETSADPVNGS